MPRRADSLHFDVVIVGGSLAGCAAATLFARRGARVAVVERSPDPDAYKRVCTHFIQPSATPAIRRLGLAKPIEAAGGVRNSTDLWSRYGWTPHDADPGAPHGYSIRRERLDPIVRKMAAETPGVTMLLGRRVRALVQSSGRVVGVRARSSDDSEEVLGARMVVAADGRSSDVAGLAGVPTRSWHNDRFAYWTYYADLPLRTGTTGQLWFPDADVAYAFPNDEGLTLIALWARLGDLPRFRRDADAVARERFARLAEAPRLEDGTRVERWLGKVDMPNIWRRPVHRGMALVGDAAQASDPLWGVGCGWAFQSAEWLVDATAPALGDHAHLDAQLRAYARRHRSELLPHHLVISEYSRGRRFLPFEKLMFAAGPRDAEVARHIHRFAGRLLPVHRFMSPRMMLRAGAAVAAPRRSRPGVRMLRPRPEVRARIPRSGLRAGLGDPPE